MRWPLALAIMGLGWLENAGAQGLAALGGQDLVIQTLQTTPSCSLPTTAGLCRLLPWIPHMKEGVWAFGGTGLVVFSREHLPRDFFSSLDKVAPDHVALFTALAVLLHDSFASAMSAGPFPILAVMEVQHRAGGIKPKWLYVAPSQGLQGFAGEYRDKLLPSLASSDGEWSPPKDTNFPGSFFSL